MPTTVNRTFSYTGASQSLVLPSNYINGTLVCKLWGAGGGQISGDTDLTGGSGDTVVCTIPGSLASANDTIHVYVGGGAFSNAAGWNGGGRGGQDTSGRDAYGGGGASDLRVGGTSLSDRIAVAGGGGGTPGYTNAIGGHAGSGGHTSGEDGYNGGFPPYVAGSGYGGTQSAGGAGGNSAGGLSNTSADGALGSGGRGSDHASSGAVCGGGGGAGLYGGGGGGGTPDPTGVHPYVAGCGAGGSSWTHASITGESYGYISNGNIAKPRNNGQIQVSYQVRDPITAVDAFSASGSMSVDAPVIIKPSVTAASVASMSVAGTRTAMGGLALVSRASASILRAPSSIFSATVMAGTAGLHPSGLRSTTASAAYAVQASLLIQQTLGSLPITTVTAMTIGTQSGVFRVTPLAAHASVSLASLILGLRALSLASTGGVSISGSLTQTEAPAMAVHGSVSLSGALSVPIGALMPTRASMTVSGALIVIGVLPLFAASALLESFTPAIRHDQILAFSTQSVLATTPNNLVIVGPTLASYGSLNLVTRVTRPSQVPMRAVIALLLDLSVDGGVYQAPYLVITDAHNTVKFFVNSYPEPAGLRQVVTNVKSRH